MKPLAGAEHIYDIVLDPYSPRVSQGYFFTSNNSWYLKTVLGTYLVSEDENALVPTSESVTPPKKDTIEMPNVFNPRLRGMRSTVKNPLGMTIGIGQGKLPKREAKRLAREILEGPPKLQKMWT